MINKTTFSNGLRLITEYMPETYSSTVMVWIDAGTNVEKAEQNGISHFIEHLVFKGTATKSSKNIVQAIESTGGSINAFTDKETTCYYAKVLGKDAAMAVDVLLDMVFNSRFDDSDIELERQVILEEIKMYEDAPDELVHDLLIKSFWEEHPLARPITGSEKTVKAISRTNILDFVRDYYTPDNMIISVAGNFNEEEIINLIKNLTENITAHSMSKCELLPVAKPLVNVKRKNIEQAHICIGTKAVSVLDKDRYALAIIDVCLGGGMSSRLFQTIREQRGLAYSINTYEALYRPSGIFGIYSGVNCENVNEVIKLTYEEIDRFKSDGLGEEEFLQAKEQLKGSLLIGLESTKYRAGRNGRSELYFNKTINAEELCSEIDNVSTDDIKRMSDFIFNKNSTAVYILAPKSYKHKGGYFG